MTKTIRQPLLVDLQASDGASARVAARSQNFTIERLVGEQGQSFPLGARTEIIVLLPVEGAQLSGDRAAELPGHAIAILPAGHYSIQPSAGSEVYVLASDRSDTALSIEPVSASAYAVPDERVRPVGAPYTRIARQNEIRIHRIEDVAIPPDNGRLRFIQSETMSINWVEYSGVRDRSALSPHAHADAEQASLAIEGDFVHHLRTPWGRDADLWREDQHLLAGPGTVMIIPPEIIHTTEGSGEGRHVLIDVFAPPRQDFIARNWVFNAHEYAAPAELRS
jgi:hypothetical protein